MRHTHVLLLLALVGWLGSGASDVQAQATPPSPVTPFEATAPPGEPPTPQFTRIAVVIGADGLAFRVLYDPAWVDLFRPQVRVGRVRTEPQAESDTAPHLEGGADELQRALAQALDRAQPSAEPSP